MKKMAPSAIETTDSGASLANTLKSKHVQRIKNADGSPLYPDYMPFYDPLEKVEDIGLFEHNDAGHRADPAMPNLLGKATKLLTCRRTSAPRSRACSCPSCLLRDWTS